MKALKKYLSKKEYIIFMISVLVIMLSVFSYAFYLSTDEINNNVSTTECFKLTIEEENEINLEKAYPISEEEAEELRPYKFTIKNICPRASNYQVNIETLDASTMETLYLRNKIDDNTSNILGTLENVTTYVNDNVIESRKIAEGLLLSNEEVTYNLRVWIDNDATVEQSAEKIWRGKVVVISSLNKNPYKTITLNTNGGTVEEETIEGIIGRTIPELPEPTRNNYSFEGWYIDSEFTKPVTNSTVVTNEMSEVYAKWEKIYKEVTLNLNGGEYSESTIRLALGDVITNLPEPAREKYIFEGWYIDSELTQEITETTIMTNSISNIYAKWKLACEYEVGELVFNNGYTGNQQTFTPKCDGRYKLEVWGAQGGCGANSGTGFDSNSGAPGGKGGYSYGIINLNKTDNAYIYVGGAGQNISSSVTKGGDAGYNGGGAGALGSISRSGGGGGASDIRINSNSLYARVIVAGGGGSTTWGPTSEYGGYGGGLEGGSGLDSSSHGTGGTQTSGGYNGNSGTFGYGANAIASSSQNASGAGGGGWYGGGSGESKASGSKAHGGGGSGYVYTSSTASNYPSGCLLNSSYYLTNAQTIAGNVSFTAPTGGTETGHSGNGYAKITYLGE